MNATLITATGDGAMTKITAKHQDGRWIATWKPVGSENRAEPRHFRTAADLQKWADENLSPCFIREV